MYDVEVCCFHFIVLLFSITRVTSINASCPLMSVVIAAACSVYKQERDVTYELIMLYAVDVSV